MEKLRNFIVLTAIAALFGCAPSDDRGAADDSPRSGGDARFASAPIPARLVAESRADIPELARGAANLSDEILLSRQGLRFVEASSLPFLTSSVEGAAYLGADRVRALARGEPAHRCPAAAAVSGAASRPAAVAASLEACFAQLAARGADADCGCRVAALDEFLLDRRVSFGYATAVSALVVGDGREPAHLIAEALPPEGREQTVVLRDLNGEIGRAVLSGDQAQVRLNGAPERIFAGPRNRFGYRRGRMAERLELADEGGARLNVLIGVERRDVVRQ